MSANGYRLFFITPQGRTAFEANTVRPQARVIICVYTRGKYGGSRINRRPISKTNLAKSTRITGIHIVDQRRKPPAIFYYIRSGHSNGPCRSPFYNRRPFFTARFPGYWPDIIHQPRLSLIKPAPSSRPSPAPHSSAAASSGSLPTHHAH